MHERSAGIIVYRLKNNEIQYLLLHYLHGHGYWDFSKGHLEKDETELVAAIRELKEETGITNITFVEGFEHKLSYYFMKEHQKIFKEVTYFLAETNEDKVIISEEHVGFLWAPYNKAMEMMAFENSKETLKKANNAILMIIRA